MPKAYVRIALDIGEDSNTWVTIVPVHRSYPYRSSGVARAAGEAVSIFIESILRDREAVAERLSMEQRDA